MVIRMLSKFQLKRMFSSSDIEYPKNDHVWQGKLRKLSVFNIWYLKKTFFWAGIFEKHSNDHETYR
jgi:hypothetical protein